MKLHPRLSRAAVELVKRFETFEPNARPAPLGGWTVGYGHTRTAREGAVVSHQDAEALLLYDLSAAAETVSQAVFAPLNAHQFDALTAFAFNVGPENFRGSSALARINAGAYLDAADEIERWRLAELGSGAQVVDALVRRRAAEKAHFLSLPAGASTSPSGTLRPLTGPDAGPIVSGEPEALQHTAGQGGVAPEVVGEPSAVLVAANTVQARLRELIPDAPPPVAAVAPEPVAPSPIAPRPVAREVEPPAPPASKFAPIVAPLSNSRGVAAPLIAAAGLVGAAEPPPPPFANDHGVIAPDPLSEEGLDAPAEIERHVPDAPPARPAEPVPPKAAAPATAKAKREAGSALALLRFLPHLIGLIGLILFAGAVMAILKGHPNLPSLALGLVGAVVMAGALYKLLDRPNP